MCINVACCADITVTKPLLNFLQAHAIGIEQTGTTMAQVGETDMLHLMCYQKIREMLAQEIGPNPLSHRVYMDLKRIILPFKTFPRRLPSILTITITAESKRKQNGCLHSIASQEISATFKRHICDMQFNVVAVALKS